MDNLRQIEKKADGRAACKGITPDRTATNNALQRLEKASGAGEIQPHAEGRGPGVLRAQWSTDH
ncbi:hypothetical protein [Pseudomonas sp. W5-36]|uniref:hypothetical protein n=1 Tax=Pseudomonas sp. W5-36 TaxID=3097455 RepID=UPI00397E69B0